FMKYEIKEMEISHWEQVREIYIEGIRTKITSFQSEFDLPSWEKWNQDHISTCRLVAIFNDVVLGWAALSPYSKRTGYSGVAEVSIYVKEQYIGLGIGKELLNKLIDVSEDKGFWTLQSGI